MSVPQLLRSVTRRSLIAIAIVLLLLTLGYFEENWRGERDWQRHRTAAEARGTKLRLSDFTPPVIPDAENFAAIPLFQDVFAASEAGRPIPNPFELPPANGIKHLQDLSAWRDRFLEAKWIADKSGDPARDVLLALSRCDASLQQLREAASRPSCRYPVDWSRGVEVRLPHMVVLQSVALVLSLRIHSLAALGEQEAAYADWRLSCRLIHSLEKEPLLISGLVRNALIDLMTQALRTGLIEDRWSDSDVQRFAADLSRLRPLDAYLGSLASERGFMNDSYESASRDPRHAARSLREVGGLFGTQYRWPFPLYPGGWARMSQVRRNELCDEMERRVDATHGTVASSQLDEDIDMEIGDAGILQRLRLKMAYDSMLMFGTIEPVFLRAAVFIDQARIACALELYRKSHGSYPERLSDVAPKLTPQEQTDPYSGSSFQYARTSTGYRLWSIGPNRRDDGGIVNPAKSRLNQLDLTWEIP